MVVDRQGIKKTIEKRMREEELIRERIDKDGNHWKKVYFGGGEHFRNWLDQSKELGEVMVEEVDCTGYKCFEETGEKLYRIWLKIRKSAEGNGLFNEKN